MSILFYDENKIFHLQTPNTSYIMAAARDRFLAHIYWGKQIHTPQLSHALLYRLIGFSAVADETEPAYSMDYMNQEFPVGTSTDYRTPALCVLYPDGSRVCDLEYISHRIFAGKPALPGLPAAYVEDEEEADSLEILLEDKKTGLQVFLLYTVYNTMDVITRSVRVENKGDAPVLIEKIMSASVDFDNSDYDMLELSGAWGRERHIERVQLRSGMQSIGSCRGASSHQLNPFFALAEKHATEDYGHVYGFNFIYSGNFTAGAWVDQIFKTRAFIGLNDYDFSWQLMPGEVFQAPETAMVFSEHGFGQMSRTFHKLYRTRLVRGKYRDSARPILVNNWEATYFDFNEEKIIGLAKEAANLGMELLVLDDGWFGKRNADNCSLGDWFVNREKLPGGIDGLAEKVNETGLKFGLWLEPEMVSPDSELYRKHPDWCIHVPGRKRTECRCQLILDLSRREVCDYIIDAVNSVLDSANIEYVKWDMNRHMTELGSAALPPERQKEMPHRYMLGLYQVMEAIVSAHPDILFESCSGGGGRFDPGMLYYMPQTWTSDDTDPIERLYIQYGTSMAYPVSSMGAHVSAVPNHQSGRITPLKTRGDVAMSGNFGYELDLTALSQEEKEEIRSQVAYYKKLRAFVQSGGFYRLENPFEGNTAAWMVLSEDKKEVFAAYFRICAVVNPGVARLKLTALDPDAYYQDQETGEKYRGDELMEIGILMEMYGDFQSRTFYLKKM